MRPAISRHTALVATSLRVEVAAARFRRMHVAGCRGCRLCKSRIACERRPLYVRVMLGAARARVVRSRVVKRVRVVRILGGGLVGCWGGYLGWCGCLEVVWRCWASQLMVDGMFNKCCLQLVHILLSLLNADVLWRAFVFVGTRTLVRSLSHSE